MLASLVVSPFQLCLELAKSPEPGQVERADNDRFQIVVNAGHLRGVVPRVCRASSSHAWAFCDASPRKENSMAADCKAPCAPLHAASVESLLQQLFLSRLEGPAHTSSGLSDTACEFTESFPIFLDCAVEHYQKFLPPAPATYISAAVLADSCWNRYSLTLSCSRQSKQAWPSSSRHNCLRRCQHIKQTRDGGMSRDAASNR